VVEVAIPPLRDRGADEVEVLARHFADSFAARYKRPEPQFQPDALAMLRGHRWPGNVRELEHWVESAIALAPDGIIRAELFPAQSRPVSSESLPPANGVTLPLGLSLEEAERRYVEATLQSCDGNKSEAAKRLQVGRNSIGRWLKP
ncbi:MAG: sigma-54-dependent Fis family transcriptional regulator, partial [Myxococcales bacterium]|nr:sigma-54-dependent Fis family transcriptional regulator [Myxococcales bacterium]